MSMTKNKLESYVSIINKVIIDEGEFLEPIWIEELNTFVTMDGRLMSLDWPVTTVIKDKGNSISMDIQVPVGHTGYSTDILKSFLTEETIQKYAEHALNSILIDNRLG